MATKRIDGTSAATSLIERITIEDSVGSNLAVRTRDDYAKKINYIGDILKSRTENLTPSNLMEYLKKRFADGEIAQSTGRSFKAASLYWLAEEAQSRVGQGLSIDDHEKAYSEIRKLDTKLLPKNTNVTSSQKLKHFPKEMLSNLLNNAPKSKSKNMANLTAFLEANLLLGLRPNEWFDVQFFCYLDNNHKTNDLNYVLDGNKKLKSTIAISIGNSKTSNGRSNGERREILLNNISPENLAKLMLMREIANNFSNKFPIGSSHELITEKLFKPLQQTLNQSLKRLGYPAKTIPTVYSTRHQAVANAKFSGLTDREIAAMFGHGSTKTAKRHYGKKMSGWQKIEFIPTLESINAVIDNARMHENIVRRERILTEANEWTSAANSDGNAGNDSI